MKLYSTVKKEGSAEQIIEKSRFIAYIKPINDRLEGEEFIKFIKKKHRDATHNVPVIVLGDKFQIQWASDDGEPQGTSGAPVLHMLVNRGITNVAMVITRYFGGIKLGTGGLVRAYTSSGELVLKEAGIVDAIERWVVTYALDYSFLTKLQNMSESIGFQIQDLKYLDYVEVKVSMDIEEKDKIKRAIEDLTSGKAIIENEEELVVLE